MTSKTKTVFVEPEPGDAEPAERLLAAAAGGGAASSAAATRAVAARRGRTPLGEVGGRMRSGTLFALRDSSDLASSHRRARTRQLPAGGASCPGATGLLPPRLRRGLRRSIRAAGPGRLSPPGRRWAGRGTCSTPFAARGWTDASVLDIGGGVGVIGAELLAAGAASSTTSTPQVRSSAPPDRRWSAGALACGPRSASATSWRWPRRSRAGRRRDPRPGHLLLSATGSRWWMVHRASEPVVWARVPARSLDDAGRRRWREPRHAVVPAAASGSACTPSERSTRASGRRDSEPIQHDRGFAWQTVLYRRDAVRTSLRVRTRGRDGHSDPASASASVIGAAKRYPWARRNPAR